MKILFSKISIKFSIIIEKLLHYIEKYTQCDKISVFIEIGGEILDIRSVT